MLDEEGEWRQGGGEDVQTSVAIPPIITWDLLAAITAERNSALSHAFTSPFRWMTGTLGYQSMNSPGSGPFGPEIGVISTW